MQDQIEVAEEAPPLRWGGESPRHSAGYRPGSFTAAAGLLSGMFASRAADPSPPADLESPLLPGDEDEEQELIEHSLEEKQWPALRGSSISARRITHRASIDQPSPPTAAGGTTPLKSAPLPFGDEAGHHAAYDLLPSRETAAVVKPAVAPQAGRYTRAAVAGLVNSVIALPLQLAFAAIIFRDPFFEPMLGSLAKLVFLSSALHQLAFVALSSLPFAVGQVQDVGLIFLSAIATSVVSECSEAGWPAKDTLATVLTATTLATGIVGILVVCTGALKVAGIVQYLPLPVVGGYLAYVGFFCLAAGVSIASGVQLPTLASWQGLLTADALLKLAPALAFVLLIILVTHTVRSPFALPALLLACPLLFYAFLFAFGLTLEDAREAGWVSKPQPGDGEWQFWRAWSLYNFHDFPPSNIYWGAMPAQASKLLALYFIVAFGSSMDIAAIQADTSQDLAYDSELVTVGLSNMLTSVAGVGFSGSYIFSQTLFSLKMSVDTPLMGILLAGAELGVFMMPGNVMTYLPNWYFGGLTAWIGQDILKDWLFIAAKRISGVEYALLLATFGLVMAAGLEAGIAGGIVLAALHFAYSYSRVTMTAFTVVPSRSGLVRTFNQRTVLDMFAARITAVSLSGYMFFGSSVHVVSKVVEVAASTLDTQPHLDPDALDAAAGGGGGARQAPLAGSLPSEATLSRQYDNVAALVDRRAGSVRAQQVSKVALALAQSPRFLILDFRRLDGLDATAARSFVTLHNKLQHMGIQLIITHITARNAYVRQLLAAQGLVLRQPISGADRQAEAGSLCLWFPTLDAGCQFCEERFLEVAIAHGLCPPQAVRLTLAQVLQAHLELPRCILGAAVDYAAAAARLARYTTRHPLLVGEELLSLGAAAEEVFIVESGTVICLVDYALASVSSRAQLPALPADMQPHHGQRTMKCGPGSLVGELDFFLQRPRSLVAVVEEGGSAWRFSRQAWEAMAAADPASLVLLQHIVLRSTSLSAAHAMEACSSQSH